MQRSKTIIDRIINLYNLYRIDNDAITFDAAVTGVFKETMRLRSLTGPEGFAEMRDAVSYHEYHISIADPEFCHQLNLILNRIEMQIANR